MIALEGAYVAFAADKKICGHAFWWLIVCPFLSLFRACFWRSGNGNIVWKWKSGRLEARRRRHMVSSTDFGCLAGIFLLLERFALRGSTSHLTSKRSKVSDESNYTSIGNVSSINRINSAWSRSYNQ